MGKNNTDIQKKTAARTKQKSKSFIPTGSIPAVLWMSFFMAVPLFYILGISFCTKGRVWGVEPTLTLENYRRLWDPLYLRIFLNSFKVAFYTTVITLLLGYPFAFFTTFLPKKLQSQVMLLIMIPFWTNTLIRVYGWIIILQKKGIINTLLQSLNLISEPYSMLYHQSTVMLGIVYTMLPFMILPIYNSVEKLDQSLVEASRDLGANQVQTFFRIVVPQTASGIMTGCIMVFMPSIGIYYVADLLGGANSMLLGNLIKNQFLEARNWPFGAAISVIMATLSLTLIGLYKKVTGNDSMEALV